MSTTRISGLVVCVDYADVFERTASRWIGGLDDVVVVTAGRDRHTQELCARLGVTVHTTEAFFRHGAFFNKAGALDEGLLRLSPWDWVLLFDADVLPPADWRARLDAAAIQPGCLYGSVRLCECGCQRVLDPDTVMPGFFHLFHGRDPRARHRPLFGDWRNASGYDTVFAARWRGAWRRVPFVVTHLGEIAENWCGRGNVDGMAATRADRARRGGWHHECLSATPGDA
jgi:hypothetical protein